MLRVGTGALSLVGIILDELFTLYGIRRQLLVYGRVKMNQSVKKILIRFQVDVRAEFFDFLLGHHLLLHVNQTVIISCELLCLLSVHFEGIECR
jgi:hypothetical protein